MPCAGVGPNVAMTALQNSPVTLIARMKTVPVKIKPAAHMSVWHCTLYGPAMVSTAKVASAKLRIGVKTEHYFTNVHMRYHLGRGIDILDRQKRRSLCTILKTRCRKTCTSRKDQCCQKKGSHYVSLYQPLGGHFSGRPFSPHELDGIVARNTCGKSSGASGRRCRVIWQQVRSINLETTRCNQWRRPGGGCSATSRLKSDCGVTGRPQGRCSATGRP